jgi:hypothetical protein
MTLISISIGLALLLLFLAGKAAVAQTAGITVSQCDVRELETVIETFASLTAPSEDDYLREALNPRDYVRCRQARALLARKCLRHIGATASLVTSLGVSTDMAAPELTKAAAAARISASVNSMYLFCLWLFPQWLGSFSPRVAGYKRFLREVCIVGKHEQPI